MKEQEAKSLLTKAKRPELWFGVEYNLNVYRGCTHGCIYCDSRSECYRIEDFEDVTAKVNAPELLRRELSRKRSKAVIGTGAMSDPYLPVERSRKLTRGVLEVLSDARFPVHVITKSDLIVRDLDVLQQISTGSLASAAFTVTTCDAELASWLEPRAPSPQARLAAMKALSDNGIYTGVLLMPVLPYILDDPAQIMTVVEQAALHGARYIIPWFGVTLRDRQRDYYYRKLDERRPGLSAKYRQVFGSRYSCDSPGAKQLYAMVEERCREYGMACRMSEVLLKPQAASAGQAEQLEFF